MLAAISLKREAGVPSSPSKGREGEKIYSQLLFPAAMNRYLP